MRSIGHFPQVLAVVQLTRRTGSSLPDHLTPQVGFGSEYSIDSIGCYWFYCNASNRFVQKCPLCTTDLSHVTGIQKGNSPPPIGGQFQSYPHRHRACLFGGYGEFGCPPSPASPVNSVDCLLKSKALHRFLHLPQISEYNAMRNTDFRKCHHANLRRTAICNSVLPLAATQKCRTTNACAQRLFLIASAS